MDKIVLSVSDLVKEISYQIVKDSGDVVTLESVTASANKILQFERKRCNGRVAKNNGRCHNFSKPGLHYCLKHTPFDDELDANSLQKETVRCKAFTLNGHQCIKDANKDTNEYCSIHLSQQRMKKRRGRLFPCVFYKNSETDHKNFCNKTAEPSSWMCSKHSHLQNQFSQNFQSANHEEYIELVKNEDIKKNTFLEKYILPKES
jgi:hypothetical protein